MKTSLTLLLIIICFNCYSQTTSKTEKNNFSIITNSPHIFANGTDNISYRGNKSFHHSFDSLIIDPEEKINKAFTFNENEQILQIVEYSGDPYSCNVFYYTKDRKLDKSYYLGNISNADALLDSLVLDINYLKNNFTTLARSCDVPLITKYKYNQTGLVSSSIIINRDGDEKSTDYQYDEKGRIIKVLKDKVLKYVYYYDTNNNISVKESASQLFNTPIPFKYTEAERYTYANNELIQIDQVYKSNKKINISIPSKKVNESVTLTPTMANSVIYMNSKMAKISFINNVSPKWETISSMLFENTSNEFHNWLTRKTFLVQKNKPKKLSNIEFQTFNSTAKNTETRIK